MSILVSKCEDSYRKFSKELFTEVHKNIKVISEEEWENNKDLNKSVLFATYIRTDKDNLVLMLDKDKFAKMSYIPSVVLDGGIYANMLIDSGLMCGKELLDSVFEFKNYEALKRIVANSSCFPVGAVETSKSYVLVFNVVISADLLKDQEITLKQGFYFHPIENLKIKDSLQKEISESLIIVRK